MSLEHTITLDLSTRNILPALEMVQGDSNSRYIVASLWNGPNPYNIGSADVMFRFKKPDGTGGLYDVDETGNEITVNKNVVTIPVAAQVLTVPGDVFAQVDIYDSSNSKLASFAFKVVVTENVYPDAQIISSDYYNVLTSTISTAVEAKQSASQSAAQAAASAASAAASVEGAVKYTEAQTLTTAQKTQARDNIGAAAPYAAGSNISISGQTIATKALPCNHNMLHNWYFPRPVNQRNVSGTISKTGAYFLDRWKLTSGTVAINSDGITLNGTIVQILESAVGTPVVATVLTTAGVSEVVPVYSDTTRTFSITAQNKKLLGAKLELGSTQTLAHQNGSVWKFNELPDYGVELARCQRFCFAPFPAGAIYARAFFVGKDSIQFFVPTPVTLRTNPVLESGTISLGTWGSTGLTQGFTFTPYTALRNSVRVLATKTSHGLTDAWIEIKQAVFSVDL